MKKINFFIGGLIGGGAERVTCNLANYFNEKIYDISILTMSDEKESYNLNGDINRICLIKKEERKNFVHNLILRYKRLKKYVKNNSYDTYIVMLEHTSIMLLCLRKYIKGKIIYCERNDPKSYCLLNRILLKKLIKRADGCVFQTDDGKKYYGNRAKNSIVIPNAINDEFKGIKRSNQLEDYIVSVGRLKEQKNFKLLIEVFSEVVKEFPNYKLKIYGDGPLKSELIKLSNKLKISDKVIFAGYVNNVGDCIKNARLFVLSSDYEGMPNALMEAMAIGIPCISTNCPCGGPNYLIKDGENGLLVPVGKKEEMNKAIKKVLSDNNLQRKLGENAKVIINELSANIIYEKWEKYINMF